LAGSRCSRRGAASRRTRGCPRRLGELERRTAKHETNKVKPTNLTKKHQETR
jgi:hypothetical protein